MMNQPVIWIPIFISCFGRCTGQVNVCEIEGDWIIRYGRLTKNYEMSNPYNENRLTFSKGNVELASGFFYKSFSVNDEYPPGKYPFTYYGDTEKYRVSQDSLYLNSSPYNKWTSFKIKCLPNGILSLVNKSDSVVLAKDNPNGTFACAIKYVKVHVHDAEEGLSLFRLNYKASYSNDDRLVFEGPDTFGKYRIQKFKLKSGTFENICRRFSSVKIDKLKEIYQTETSDFTTISLEIVMQDGKVIKSEIQNKQCPDELRLALVRVLYGYQQYVYPNSKPIE